MDSLDFLTSYPELRTTTAYGELPANENFAKQIYRRAELYQERFVEAETEDIVPGRLLKQQKILGRFLSRSTPYKALMVVHEVGTGKTCGAFAIAEANKGDYRKAYFVSPSSFVNKQQQAELLRCFPQTYNRSTDWKKEKYYEFTTHNKLANKIKTKLAKYGPNGVVDAYSDSIFIVDEAHELVTRNTKRITETDLEDLRAELTELTKEQEGTSVAIVALDPESSRYIETLRELEEKRGKDAEGIKDIEDSIADIMEKTGEAAKKLDKYDQFSKLFKLARDIKIVLLTATPMTDAASEFPKLFKLVSPPSRSTSARGGAWANESLWDRKEDPRLAEAENELAKLLRGRVSYLKAARSSTGKEFVRGWAFPASITSFPVAVREKIEEAVTINLYSCMMGSAQTRVYNKAWAKGIFSPELRQEIFKDVPEMQDPASIGTKQDTWYREATQASLLTMPVRGALVYGNDIPRASLKPFFDHPPGEGGSDEERLASLYNFCPKYSESVSRILKGYTEGKKVFVFNSLVSGGASMAFAKMLQSFGYEDYTYYYDPLQGKRVPHKSFDGVPDAKRFVLLTGSTSVSKTDVLALYNRPENCYGKKIQVVIGSNVLKQAITIKDVQEMHVHIPPWNFPSLIQAIGRIIRHGSHAALEDSNAKDGSGTVSAAKVDVVLFAAVPHEESSEQLLNAERELVELLGPEDRAAKNIQQVMTEANSVDIKKYVKMQDKDKAMKRIERLIKENAMDCPLFYARNYNPHAVDGSRECDYRPCKYVCSGMETEMDSVNGYNASGVSAKGSIVGLPPSEIFWPNEESLYATRDSKELQERVIDYFRTESRASFQTLVSVVGEGSGRLLLPALSYLISHKVPITRSDGFKGYIKENDNIYYISTTPLHDSADYLAAGRPRALIRFLPEDYIDQIANEISSQFVDDPSRLGDLVEMESDQMREYLLETAWVSSRMGIQGRAKELGDIVLSKLSSNLTDPISVDGVEKVFSTLLQPNCYRSIDVSLVGTAVATQSYNWCGEPKSWPAPVYWETAKTGPPTDMTDIKNVLQRAFNNKARDGTKHPAPFVICGEVSTKTSISESTRMDGPKLYDFRALFLSTNAEVHQHKMEFVNWKSGVAEKSREVKVGNLYMTWYTHLQPALAADALKNRRPELVVPADARSISNGRMLKTINWTVWSRIGVWLKRNGTPADLPAPAGSGGGSKKGVELAMKLNIALKLKDLGLWISDCASVSKGEMQAAVHEVAGMPANGTC